MYNYNFIYILPLLATPQKKFVLATSQVRGSRPL